MSTATLKRGDVAVTEAMVSTRDPLKEKLGDRLGKLVLGTAVGLGGLVPIGVGLGGLVPIGVGLGGFVAGVGL